MNIAMYFYVTSPWKTMWAFTITWRLSFILCYIKIYICEIIRPKKAELSKEDLDGQTEDISVLSLQSNFWL